MGMKLPLIGDVATTGHVADHAALKVDYDLRHPDTPLPELGSGRIDGRVSHDVIHELLAADHNALTGGELPTELLPEIPLEEQRFGLVYMVGSPSPGHIAAHNALHEAYNARQG